ncbi:group II truncated hemoglobin [Ruegeria atlantica]|uniref:Truncated BHb n=1 Tax=Ruegeria atlantica TaxID=81569 RepID=A0A0P1EG05_9RHOB|nr:group II truncated hemoglobin [Ruegeria atlantica]CUH49110.1 Truncated BHb [Ruegeria atlantica]
MESAIEQLGGETQLRALVERFYDRMETEPAAHSLHRLHFRGHGLNHTRQAQFEFLSGFLGGRAYYRERLGHMDLREIHAHIPIRKADAELWLDTFDAALADCELTGPVVEKMRATLRRAALMLVNDVPDWRLEADAGYT